MTKEKWTLALGTDFALGHAKATNPAGWVGPGIDPPESFIFLAAAQADDDWKWSWNCSWDIPMLSHFGGLIVSILGRRKPVNWGFIPQHVKLISESVRLSSLGSYDL